jgi:SAM-dependent methyltransferase
LNLDNKVVRDFGEEWEKFNFLDNDELSRLRDQFRKYLTPLPQELLSNNNLVAADFGAGTGRWSYFIKEYCKQLYVLEPSPKAFSVCQKRFIHDKKIKLYMEPVEHNSIPDQTLDLAISLGVLHHLPDTQLAMQSIRKKIKPGGYFLGYLYYALENRKFYYRALWRFSDVMRRGISLLPTKVKLIIADFLAIVLYFPLAKLSKLFSKMGIPIDGLPLHHYSNLSFEVMRNDALDRFGTSLEQRFTQKEIKQMLEESGFDVSTLRFSDDEPFWTFSVRNMEFHKI